MAHIVNPLPYFEPNWRFSSTISDCSKIDTRVMDPIACLIHEFTLLEMALICILTFETIASCRLASSRGSVSWSAARRHGGARKGERGAFFRGPFFARLVVDQSVPQKIPYFKLNGQHLCQTKTPQEQYPLACIYLHSLPIRVHPDPP